MITEKGNLSFAVLSPLAAFRAPLGYFFLKSLTLKYVKLDDMGVSLKVERWQLHPSTIGHHCEILHTSLEPFVYSFRPLNRETESPLCLALVREPSIHK